MKNSEKIRKLTTIAVLSALAYVAVLLFRIPIAPLDFLKYGKTYGVFLVLGLVCSTSLPAYLYRRLKGTWAGAVILAVLFWLCLFCLSKGMNDPFMYFRF